MWQVLTGVAGTYSVVDDGAGEVSDEEALAVGDLAVTLQLRLARNLHKHTDTT